MTVIAFSESTVKPTRRQACAHVKKLAEHIPMAHLEELLLYFTAPPVRRPAASAAEWVARAVAAQDVRRYLCYMWVSPEGVAYGTDGHRAHIAPVEGFAPGYYDPKTLKPAPEAEGKYPNVERLMPTIAAEHSVALSDLSRQLLVNVEHDRPVYHHKGAYVMQSYLNDALNGCDALPVEIHGDGASAKWCGANEYGRYLIMGVRV